MNQNEFVISAKKQFSYYRMLGENTFAQLSDDEIFDDSYAYENNIPVIVKHLHGNMLSRWTDFLNSDGEKDWRKRDGEFQYTINSRSQLLDKWNEGWNCVLTAMDEALGADDDQLVYIRNQGHTISEAILRQAAHYAYHVGQIVYIGKRIKGKGWSSLSIPRDGSKVYNQQKFDQPKSKGHFTDN